MCLNDLPVVGAFRKGSDHVVWEHPFLLEFWKVQVERLLLKGGCVLVSIYEHFFWNFASSIEDPGLSINQGAREE